MLNLLVEKRYVETTLWVMNLVAILYVQFHFRAIQINIDSIDDMLVSASQVHLTSQYHNDSGK